MPAGPLARPPANAVRRLPALLLAIVFAATACGGAATPAPTIPDGAVVVHAHNLAFDTKQIQVPAGTQFTLAFVNEDGDMHNIAIRTKPGSDGDVVFRFDPVSSTTVILSVPPIPKGTYYFLCEVHPNMSGTVFAY